MTVKAMQQCYGIVLSRVEPVFGAKLHMHALMTEGCQSGKCSRCNAALGVLVVPNLSSLTEFLACMQQLYGY